MTSCNLLISIKEMHELLVVGVKFSDWGMVMTELDHLILGIDSLNAKLNERRPSNWDIFF